MRQSPTLSLLLATVGLVLGTCSLTVAQTTPEDPSYEDKWIETNVESSPFLELRNERDTDVPDVPDAPDAPDTPPVEDAGDAEETESSPEAKESERPDTPGVTASDTEQSADQKTDEPGETEGTTSESDESQEPTPEENRSETSPDESVGDLLRDLDPESPGGITETLDPVVDPVELYDVPFTRTSLKAQPVEPEPASPDTAWWWEYRFWLLGGLVVLFVTGMFFWSRRRRVTVIERNYPSAEDFFQDELKRSRRPEKQDEDSGGDRSFDLSQGPVTTPSDSLFETLNEHGFGEEHQALVEEYYSEGLTRREVAQQSSLGEGEVGLVLDLADRIREEKTDAERA